MNDEANLPGHIWGNILINFPELGLLTAEQIEIVQKAADYAYCVGYENGQAEGLPDDEGFIDG